MKGTQNTDLPGLDLVSVIVMEDLAVKYELQAESLPAGQDRDLLIAMAECKRGQRKLILDSYGLSNLFH